jgi:hypothetical protein
LQYESNIYIITCFLKVIFYNYLKLSNLKFGSLNNLRRLVDNSQILGRGLADCCSRKVSLSTEFISSDLAMTRGVLFKKGHSLGSPVSWFFWITIAVFHGLRSHATQKFGQEKGRFQLRSG